MNPKKIIKQSIILTVLIIILIIQSSPLSGIETKYIKYGNETLSITPQLEIIPCEIPITAVFKIQRENYTNESEILRIQYIQELENNISKTINSNEIEKEINKYSSSQTGNIYVNESGRYILKFIINNNTNEEENDQIKEWVLESSCNLNENETTNNSNTTNTTSNNTTNANNTTSLNNETNNTICFENYDLTTNKNIFSIGEQMSMVFSVEPQPSNFSVTYWIEDIRGNIIKTARTSTNLNSKSHTFSSIEEEEKSYFVKGILSDDCQHKEVEKLIVLKNEREENELNSNIKILDIKEEIKENIHFIRVEIEAYKGNTTKSVIELYAESVETNKKISLVQKIKIANKFRSSSNIIYIPLFKEEDQIKIIAEGIGVKETKVISLEKQIKIIDKDEEKKKETEKGNELKNKMIEIISTYTKNKKEQEEINWYVSVNNKYEEKTRNEKEIYLFYNNKSQKEIINITGKETYKFVLKNIQNGTEIITIVKNNKTIEDIKISTILLEEKREEEKSTTINNLNELKEINMTKLSIEKNNLQNKDEKEINEKTISDRTSLLEEKSIEMLVIILIISIIGVIIWKRREVFKSIKKASRKAGKTIYSENQKGLKRIKNLKHKEYKI